MHARNIASLVIAALLMVQAWSGTALARGPTQTPNPNLAFAQVSVGLYNPTVVDQLPGATWDARIKEALIQSNNAAVSGAPTTPGLIPSYITCDGAASVIVLAAVYGYGFSGATLSVTSGATLIPFTPDWRDAKPVDGVTSLHVDPVDLLQCCPNCTGYCALAILQAPNILKAGAGGKVDLTQPITVLVTSPAPGDGPATVVPLPPAVLFVHGLWGNDQSLAPTQAYLAAQGPWSTPGLLTNFQYDGNIAFDNSLTQQNVTATIKGILSQLSTNGIVASRVDTIAHNMGGLVMPAFSNTAINPGYNSAQNRMIGAIHHIITLNTPEAGSKLANFLLKNQNQGFSVLASPIALAAAAKTCGNVATIGQCFASINDPVNAGAVQSLQVGSVNMKALPSPAIPNATWKAFASTANQNDTASLSSATSGLVWPSMNWFRRLAPARPIVKL